MTPSPATLRVYAALVEYKTLHQGNSPTTRELAALADRSLSVIHFHLRRLEAAGLIARAYAQARSIELPGARWIPPPATDI